MILEGYLNKQEGSDSDQKRKRWFQLEPTKKILYYYKSREKEELLGFLNISDIVEINSLDEEETKLAFNIQTREFIWTLFAFSKSEKDLWIETLNKHLNERNTSSSNNHLSKDTFNDSYDDLTIFDFDDMKRNDKDNDKDNDDIIKEEKKSKKKIYKKELDDSEDDNFKKLPIMGTSTPLSIPMLSKTYHQQTFWGFTNDDDEDDVKFEKPHELAAKTYNEHFLLNMN